MAGTINQMIASAPATDRAPATTPAHAARWRPIEAARVRMITYYVSIAADPANPRWCGSVERRNANANTVGFDVEQFCAHLRPRRRRQQLDRRAR